MTEATNLAPRGTLVGHNGWVTAIAVPHEGEDVVISSSRDKSIIIWKLTRDVNSYGFPAKRLIGHGHFVQDVTVTSDGRYILSGSWDSTLRLWDSQKDKSTRFVGHSKDVLSVAFSDDNRQIVSGSRDKSIKLWNTLGKCKFTFTESGHNGWVSCVRFSPLAQGAKPVIVSAGWDKVVKVWSIDKLKLRTNLIGHTGYINSVTVSPDGSLCASGGKDGSAILWDLNEAKVLSILDAKDSINALVFSPSRYWLCAATASAIIVWDLESKQELTAIKLPPREDAKKDSKAVPIQCISLCWSVDGSILYAGYTDNVIRAYAVSK